jgi:hypothetical protein
MIGVVILIGAMVISFVWLWVGGIEYMNKHHSNYKGEDWLNWDDSEDDKDQVL